MRWERPKLWHLAMLGGLLALAGCGADGAGLFAGARGTGAHAPVEQKVMAGQVTLAGPRGFCIDEGATREDAAGAFVLLGSCSAISGNPRDAKPARPAVLTASVAPAEGEVDVGALDRMAAFFATDAGRVVLARADGGEPVEVLDLNREPGLVLVHAADREPAPGLSGDYWRGVFDLPGALVTVTVSGFAETPLSAKTGAALARKFVAAIRAVNAAPPPSDAPAPASGLGGLLGRLL